MEQQYTNELTPELAASLARPPFSAEKKARMSDGACQMDADFLPAEG